MLQYKSKLKASPHPFCVKKGVYGNTGVPKTLANKGFIEGEYEKMKLGIVAQRPIFITLYKSINVR